ncbi:MAG TPA: hypothetical protein VGG75_13900 [Trebonia sp.]|jgi:hypothetical protein
MTLKVAKRVNPGSYPELRMWAMALDDAMKARIAFENKERSGTVAMEAFGPVVELYQEAEDRLRKEMTACYRVTVPAGVRQWQEETAGIGESTLARLLGITGDPRMAYPKHWEGTGSDRHLVEDEPHPRLLSQLWQYTGHGAPKRRDVKGDAAALMSNGQPEAKKLVYLMAAAQVKSNAKGGTGYRHVYDRVKAKYSLKVHSVDCAGGYSGALYVKCKTHVPDDDTLVTDDAVPANILKPKLGYALAGDSFQPSHVHAIALRHTGKEIERDLWLAAGGQEPVFGASRAGEEGRRKGRVRPRKWVGVPGHYEA